MRSACQVASASAQPSLTITWAIERIAVPVLPLAAAMAALAVPAMRLLSFGAATDGDGPALLAVAVWPQLSARFTGDEVVLHRIPFTCRDRSALKQVVLERAIE